MEKVEICGTILYKFGSNLSPGKHRLKQCLHPQYFADAKEGGAYLGVTWTGFSVRFSSLKGMVTVLFFGNVFLR